MFFTILFWFELNNKNDIIKKNINFVEYKNVNIEKFFKILANIFYSKCIKN